MRTSAEERESMLREENRRLRGALEEIANDTEPNHYSRLQGVAQEALGKAPLCPECSRPMRRSTMAREVYGRGYGPGLWVCEFAAEHNQDTRGE